MKALVSKSNITGRVAALPSKGYTAQALVAAALTRGASLIRNPWKAEDITIVTKALSCVGARITSEQTDWRVDGGELQAPQGDLYCRESDPALLFMTALAALIPGPTRLIFSPGLSELPIKALLAALTDLGVSCSLTGNIVAVEGKGKLAGGKVILAPDTNSLCVSALLLIAARLEQGLIIELPASQCSWPDIAMTIECLRQFGIGVRIAPDCMRLQVAPQSFRPATFQVEGDWLQAAYLLALGASTGDLLVTNLNAESLQGERVVLNLMQKMGVRFTQRSGSVMVMRSLLRAIKTDLADGATLLPVLAVLAALIGDESEFRGIIRDCLKEPNRFNALCEGLGKAGMRLTKGQDTLRVVGAQPQEAVLETYADGYLVMAFAVLGAAVGNITILDADGVDKVFPGFWRVFREIGGKAELGD